MSGTQTAGGDITLFTDVDRTADPDFFTRFLDAGNALPAIRTSKAIMLDALALRGGERVLDAGCGTGDDTFDLVRLVGTAGRVIGVDVSEVMIAEARRRARTQALPVEFEVGDAQRVSAFRTEPSTPAGPNACSCTCPTRSKPSPS